MGLSHAFVAPPQGTGVECFAANPGLVNTPLNHANPRGKGDSNKATTWLVELSTVVYGQQPWRGCRSLLRTATDPSLTGELIGKGCT